MQGRHRPRSCRPSSLDNWRPPQNPARADERCPGTPIRPTESVLRVVSLRPPLHRPLRSSAPPVVDQPSTPAPEVLRHAGSDRPPCRLLRPPSRRPGRKLQDGGQGRAGQDGIGRQGGLPADKGKSQSPRFAPEFDGIDCFETIVCR
ncbi:hypothetical protein ZWY2020_045427 [Hordeum vulgare]|nr:hypothetical protein ZWY2020_045427 [Hordeum vulgare]